MTPERWRDVERLFHAALQREPDQRAAYLAAACGGDIALQQEVESLLGYRTKASGFIETPAAGAHQALAEIVDGERRQAPPAPGRLVGRVFGAYEIQALIATGGMGEVYRGVDTRLDRAVAIKTLPGRVSDDPTWRARLQREAASVSRLNHRHICTLYDVGVEHGVPYLVMEYIEGETLEARLARGPLALPMALEYATQIVDALARAHREGLVHRDVKPSNVMLTKDGVKVLDFGLAKPAATDPADAPSPEASHPLTETGTLLGTPPYMAPEQLEGRPADARTDIFSFGALVYEMLTGRRAFSGDNPARLMSAILAVDPPPIPTLVPGVPPLLAQTIARCLAKAPDDRWQTASDLHFQLRAIAAAAPEVPPAPPRHRARPGERVLWTAVVIASIAAAWMWSRPGGTAANMPAAETAAVRFTIAPPPDVAFASSYDVPLAVAPDGRALVYVAAGADGVRRLWLHALDGGRRSALPGTEGANTPFWSPDSQWVGFFADNSLKRIRPSTGIAQVVATAVSTFGGATWSPRDVIVFPAGTGGLSRVDVNGGTASPLTKGEGHFWPQFLPDGEHFIYAAAAPARIMLGSLGSDPPRTLMPFALRVSALAYAAGHVFYVQDRVLFARRFDEAALAFSDEAVRVLDGVPVVANGRAPFSVSAAGVLASWPHPIGEPAILQWFTRDGRTTVAVAAPAQYSGFALSPDERHLVFSRMDANGGADLWVRDLAGGTERQLTFDAASYTPQWSPEGTRVLFSGPGPGPPPKVFVRPVTEAGVVSRVTSSPLPDFASSWVGDAVVSVRIDPVNRNDLWLHRMDAGGDARLAIDTTANESHGKLSPDGSSIAYVSDRSGRDEVWLARLPSGEARRQISTTGGTAPQWGAGGRELFHLAANGDLMVTGIAASRDGVGVAAPARLFRMPTLVAAGRVLMPTANNYVAASDGRRFLAAVSVRDPTLPPITIVVNWPALLTRGGPRHAR
jgi:eukaryotic-like serine/threonine-protein kinase